MFTDLKYQSLSHLIFPVKKPTQKNIQDFYIALRCNFAKRCQQFFKRFLKWNLDADISSRRQIVNPLLHRRRHLFIFGTIWYRVLKMNSTFFCLKTFKRTKSDVISCTCFCLLLNCYMYFVGTLQTKLSARMWPQPRVVLTWTNLMRTAKLSDFYLGTSWNWGSRWNLSSI